jgi:hypothetical protein
MHAVEGSVRIVVERGEQGVEIDRCCAGGGYTFECFPQGLIEVRR